MKELAEHHLAAAYVPLADTVALCETGKCALLIHTRSRNLKSKAPDKCSTHSPLKPGTFVKCLDHSPVHSEVHEFMNAKV